MSVKNWRDTARIPRITVFDVRLLVPVFIFLLHIRTWTFCIAVASIVFFTILERKGYTLEVLWRLTRSKLAGRYRIVSDEKIWRKRCRW